MSTDTGTETLSLSMPTLDPRLLRPASGRAVVYFPLVGSDGDGLGSLECMPWGEAGGRRFMVSHPRFNTEVEQILADSRFNETAGHSEDCVRVRFAPSDFGGGSYGLALAIADKMARFGATGQLVYATGRIAADGHGAVGAIDHFEAKLMLIENCLRSGDVFAFPQQNLDQLSAEARRSLALLGARSGVHYRPVSHIDELNDIFTLPEPDATPRHPRPRRRRDAWLAATGVAATLAAGAGIYGWWQYRQAGDAAPPLRIEAVYDHAGRGELRPLTATSELRAGDRYRLSFTVSGTAPRYVYVLQTDGSGWVFCLYPRSHFDGVALAHANPVRPDRTYHTPAPDQWFELDQQTGRETIQVFAYEQPRAALADFCRNAHQPPGGIRQWLQNAPSAGQQRLSFQHVD